MTIQGDAVEKNRDDEALVVADLELSNVTAYYARALHVLGEAQGLVDFLFEQRGLAVSRRDKAAKEVDGWKR